MGRTFSGLGTFRMHVIQNSQVYVGWPSRLCIENIAIDIYIGMLTKYAWLESRGRQAEV